MEISSAEALALRIRSLLLSERNPTGGSQPQDVAGAVSWFGAMQAQDLGSGLWSFGVRLPELAQVGVEAALERREALRTWPMRGTVHFVPSRDARWMLDLMGVRALAGAARRREFLGLDEIVADRAVEVLGSALAGGGRLTRAECVATLEAAGIPTAGQLAYHLLWYSSQRGVTCIAPNVEGEQTFVLLEEWVPDPHLPERDEALAIMALRYFRSHGPTTRKDFAGWTGLTMADAKTGIAEAGDLLATVTVDGQEMIAPPMLLADIGAEQAEVTDEVWALPGFDEYLLGFKDRSLMLAEEHKQAIIPGGNGVFQWTIVRNGRVVATWKRTKGKAKTVVEVLPLSPIAVRDMRAVEAALVPYGRFVDRPLEVRWA